MKKLWRLNSSYSSHQVSYRVLKVLHRCVRVVSPNLAAQYASLLYQHVLSNSYRHLFTIFINSFLPSSLLQELCTRGRSKCILPSVNFFINSFKLFIISVIMYERASQDMSPSVNYFYKPFPLLQ
jgi:hypothetical protein